MVRAVIPLTSPKFPGNKNLTTFGGGNHPMHYEKDTKSGRVMSIFVMFGVSSSISLAVIAGVQ